MRVLFFTSSFPRSLTDTSSVFIKELGDELASRDDIEIIVLTPAVPSALAFETMNRLRVIRYQYFIPHRWQMLTEGSILDQLRLRPVLILQIPFMLCAALFSLITIARQESIDIIHAHWLLPQGFIATLYKKFINKKIAVLCTVHGSDINALRAGIFRLVQKWTIANLNHVAVVSPVLANKPLMQGAHNVSIVPMGINKLITKVNPRPLQKSSDSLSLLFVGRLVKKKGLHILLPVIPFVLQVYHNTQFIIVGAGPERARLEAQARTLKIETHVSFVGSTSHEQVMNTYYSAAHIMLAASETEGLGLVFLEALRSGIPVVTTSVGIIPHLTSKNIYVFSLDDEPKKIAEQIILAANIGYQEEATFTAELDAQYSWPAVAAQYHALYEQIKIRKS